MRQAYAYSVVLLLLVIVGCGSPIPFDAVCQINTPGCSGSGALIGANGNRGLVLSCRHVCQTVGADVELLWLATGETTIGRVIDVLPGDSFNNDLALIECVKPQNIEPAVVAEFHAQNGPFVTLGYRRREMYMSIATGATEENGLIKLSAPLIGGVSGGPCCDRFGRIIGVGVGTGKYADWAVASDGKFLIDLILKYRE